MDFQKKILIDQRAHVLEQFQEATDQWSAAKKSMTTNFQMTKKAFEDSDVNTVRLNKVSQLAELDLLLQQLNFQRAWIETKLKNLEKNDGRPLTDPVKDQRQVQEMALETQFLKDFPVRGKSFIRKLKKLLAKNKMTVQSDLGKSSGLNGLPKPSFAKLKKSIKKQPNLTPTKTWNQSLAFLRTHPALDRLRNAHGNFEAPNFSKEAVEELLGHKVSFMTLTKIQKGLALAPKRIKKRKRKSEKREG